MHLIKYFEAHNRVKHLSRARHLQLVTVRGIAKRDSQTIILDLIKSPIFKNCNSF